MEPELACAAVLAVYLLDRVEAHPAIGGHVDSPVKRRQEPQRRARHGPVGEIVIPSAGLFSPIGAKLSCDWLSVCAALDGRGFLLTDLCLRTIHLDGSWQSGATTAVVREE